MTRATVSFSKTMTMKKSLESERFVFHRTMPKSMEAYCQESGRAGRDGEDATCVVFYRRADICKVAALMNSNVNQHESEQDAMAKIRSVIKYCENTTDCRRKLMALPFGELVNPATDCAAKCDVCRSQQEGGSLQIEDVSVHAKDLLDTLETRTKLASKRGKVTFTQLIELWRPTPKWTQAKRGMLIAQLIAENGTLTLCHASMATRAKRVKILIFCQAN